MNKKFLFFALVIFGFLELANSARALTISPAKGLVTVNRGAEQVVKITVFNESSSVNVVAPIVLGTRQDSQGKLIFEKNIDDVEKWVKTDNQNVTLSPGEKKDLFFTITPPTNAYPGSHYVGLGARVSGGVGSVGLSGQLISTITVQVAGVANESLKIKDFTADKKILVHKNISFDLVVKNNGNVEVTPAGQLTVLSWGGKEIANEDFYLGNQLLVDSERTINHKFNLNRIFWPGLYQAKILLRYGLTSSQIETTTQFVYLPIWSWVVLLFFISLVVAIFDLVFKKIKIKKNVHQK